MSRYTGPGRKAVRGDDAASHPRLSEYISKARKAAGDLVNQIKLGGIWSGVREMRIADDAIVRVNVMNNIDGLEPIVNMELFIERGASGEERGERKEVLAAFVVSAPYSDDPEDRLLIYRTGAGYVISAFDENSSFVVEGTKFYGDKYGVVSGGEAAWKRKINGLGIVFRNSEIISWDITGTNKYFEFANGTGIYRNGDLWVEAPNTVLGAGIREQEDGDYLVAVLKNGTTFELYRAPIVQDSVGEWQLIQSTLELEGSTSTAWRGCVSFSADAVKAIGVFSSTFGNSDGLLTIANYIVRVDGDSISAEEKIYKEVELGFNQRDRNTTVSVSGDSYVRESSGTDIGVAHHELPAPDFWEPLNAGTDYTHVLGADWDTDGNEVLMYLDCNGLKDQGSFLFSISQNWSGDATSATHNTRRSSSLEVGGAIFLVVEVAGEEVLRESVLVANGGFETTLQGTYSSSKTGETNDGDPIYTGVVEGEGATETEYSYSTIRAVNYVDLTKGVLVLTKLTYSASGSGSYSGSGSEEQLFSPPDVAASLLGSSSYSGAANMEVVEYEDWSPSVLFSTVTDINGPSDLGGSISVGKRLIFSTDGSGTADAFLVQLSGAQIGVSGATPMLGHDGGFITGFLDRCRQPVFDTMFYFSSPEVENYIWQATVEQLCLGSEVVRFLQVGTYDPEEELGITQDEYQAVINDSSLETLFGLPKYIPETLFPVLLREGD